MGVTRRIVLPTIRIILLAAIAVGVLWIAFGRESGNESEGAPLTPSVEIVRPEVQVSTGTVTNTVEIQATITADAPTPVRATDGGTVTVFLAEPGHTVVAGEPLLEVVFEEVGEPTVETDDDGNEVEVPGEPVRRFRTIEAPVGGMLGEFAVLAGEEVTIGDQVTTISTGGFTVSGTLTAEQQYRLIGGPTAADIQARGGPAPFTCNDLVIGRDAGSGSGGEGGDDSGAPPAEVFPGDPAAAGGSSTAISCTVPEGVTVFDGLGATMSVQAGQAESVLVVPVTAVEGSFETGNVWTLGPDGEPVEKPVTLGLTDGEIVEVREGLAEGDTILEFVPGQDEETMAEERYGVAG